MAGIHRPVDILRKPRGANIADFRVQGDADGRLNLSVDLLHPCLQLLGVDASDGNNASSYCVAAALFDDEQGINGEVKRGEEVWTATMNVPTKPIRNEIFDGENLHVVEFSQIVCEGHPKLWCAEDPNLYTVVLALYNNKSTTPLQVESCRVGFRTVNIKDGVLTINGKAITICGVNRHEHDPDHGKVVSIASMKRDVEILK